MVDEVSRPEEQTGTGEPRTRPAPTGVETEVQDGMSPPTERSIRLAIPRSGSGGSGGPEEGDPREEGSGSGSLEEMLSGTA
jgi:hypothetical protein